MKRLAYNTILLLPAIFIVCFGTMLFLEIVKFGSIPDFINTEQSYSILSELGILLFYITLISCLIMLPIVNLRLKTMPKMKIIWLISYDLSALSVLGFVFFNPFNIFIWFMG